MSQRQMNNHVRSGLHLARTGTHFDVFSGRIVDCIDRVVHHLRTGVHSSYARIAVLAQPSSHQQLSINAMKTAARNQLAVTAVWISAKPEAT
jgi:hypothetical protein